MTFELLTLSVFTFGLGIALGVMAAAHWTKDPAPDVETRLPTSTFQAMVTALWSAKDILSAIATTKEVKVRDVATALAQVNAALGAGNGRAAQYDPKRKGGTIASRRIELTEH